MQSDRRPAAHLKFTFQPDYFPIAVLYPGRSTELSKQIVSSRFLMYAPQDAAQPQMRRHSLHAYQADYCMFAS